MVKQAESVLNAEPDKIANMANLASMLFESFGHHWIGFYRVVEDELVLGPFQGPVACTRIKFNKGVCGTSWAQERTLIVEDVHQFEGHIACSPYSNSEIVVPCISDGKVWAVLDIDSVNFAEFDETDKGYLEKLVTLL